MPGDRYRNFHALPCGGGKQRQRGSKNSGKLISSGSKEQVFTKENLSLAYGGNWENSNKVLWKVY